ncbi:MAG TPA: response regulator transcription factor [Clostridia bacterium]|nr:response regulator transcription factor [Clostridia bacterium]
MIKIIIADDQPVMRDGLKFIIEQNADLEVVGCAGNGMEAFELCRQLQPDVVLMDIVMPGCDGVEATKRIKEKYEKIKVIILTTFNDEEKVEQALRNGADGYVLKAIESEELILTIKSITRGLQVIHKNAYGIVRKKLSLQPEPKDFGLTEREMEVIRLVVFGKSNKGIASTLYLSEGSVRNIISSILFKTKLKDRTQLAVFAVKNNIV